MCYLNSNYASPDIIYHIKLALLYIFFIHNVYLISKIFGEVYLFHVNAIFSKKSNFYKLCDTE